MVATPGNGLNITSAGIVVFDGTATFSADTVTQHDVLVGGASNAITSVAPSGTSGVPLISQGASSDPAFGTAVVAGGGTGAVSFNINGPVISNTTTTGALAAVTLASQQFLVGNSGAPTAKALSVVRQVFMASGTYTPTSGMVYCDIECLGGGGGGGGAATSGAGLAACAGAGGGGGYSRKIVSAATIGTSKSLIVGSAGIGGAAGSNAGGTGGTSTVGAILSATGGVGGTAGVANGVGANAGGTGGVGSGGDFNTTGSPGGTSAFLGGSFVMGSTGGSSFFGGGGLAITQAVGVGNAATSYGGGGAGAIASNSAAAAGGAGANGIVIITEYVIS